jgi:hypothetical protein
VLLIVALAFLVGLAWTGLNGGFNLLAPSHTRGQKVQAYAQMAFGFFALLSAVTTFRGRRWWALALAGFTISLSLAAGLFAVVWSHMSVGLGILSGAVAFLVALGIIWLLRIGARGPTSA